MSEGSGSEAPLVTAVILNFDGGDLVLRCLASVVAQDYPRVEVVVVDSASSDDSLDRIRRHYPDARLVPLGHNRGYAGGMNAGIRASNGGFLALVNLDAELDPSYLTQCVGAFSANDRLGGVTGKLLKATDHHPPLIDTTGHIVFRNRRPIDRGEWEEDVGQYDSDTEVFGVCGAAPVYRRGMLDDIAVGSEYFDEDFFAYFEDFDLSWRGRLRGWEFSYVPGAVGRHHRGASGGKASTFILACNHRNRLLTILKCDHPRSFLRHLPGIAYTELRAIIHMLGVRPSAIPMAWGHLIRLLPRMWRKRKAIQGRRRVGWRELEPWFQPYGYRGSLRRITTRAAR